MSANFKKKVIVLCGVSGSGKTWARTHHEALKDLPAVDVADAYRDNPEATYLEATASVVKQVKNLLLRYDTVVVEGYYLPNSLTRNMVKNGLREVACVEFRLLYAPIEVCRQRVECSGERVDIRLEVLERVWAGSGRMLTVLNDRGYTWKG